jgi:hypothetical protein
MPRTGKCPNYAGCLLAYRGEVVTIADDVPFDCPECHQPLIQGGSVNPMAIQWFILGGLSLLVLMGAGAVYYQVLNYRKGQVNGQIGTSFEQAQLAVEHGEFMPSRHMPVIADTPPPAAATTPFAIAAPSAYPTSTISIVRAPDPDLQNSQTDVRKADILKSVDLTPGITVTSKDKLYLSIKHAREMGKLATIMFPSGKVALDPGDIDALRAVFAAPQPQTLLQDPKCLLLVLGFGDRQRARNVLSALRDRCGVLNVMYAIPMGGSVPELPSGPNSVEIWALRP